MAIEKEDEIDAIGIETASGMVVLTILDSWPWVDEGPHLMALQSKLNAYFDFVESGQLVENYPDAKDRMVVIEVIGRFPLPEKGTILLEKAREAAMDLEIGIRTQFVP